MCFNIRNALWLNTRHGHGFGDDFDLTLDTGSSIANFCRPIIIDSGATDDSINSISISHSIRETLQGHYANTASSDRSTSFGIKCSAVTVRRQNTILLIEIAPFLWDENRGTASQCHIAFIAQ